MLSEERNGEKTNTQFNVGIIKLRRHNVHVTLKDLRVELVSTFCIILINYPVLYTVGENPVFFLKNLLKLCEYSNPSS